MLATLKWPKRLGQGLLLLLSGLLLLPITAVLFSLFSPKYEIWEHLLATVFTRYLGNSLLLVVGVVAISLCLGVIPAWLLTMFRFPLSRALEWLMFLPITLPAYITGYVLTGALDSSSTLQHGLRQLLDLQVGEYWFPEIRSLGGAILVLSFSLYPYIYMLARAAFMEQSMCALQVARTLGLGHVALFFRVALPLARPYLITGASLVLMETLADYGTVQYFGVDTLITGVFRIWFGFGDSDAAAQLAAVLLCLVFLLFALEHISRRKACYHHTTSTCLPITQQPIRGKWLVVAYLACLLPVVGGFLVPFSYLSVWALTAWPSVVWGDFSNLVAGSMLLSGVGAFLVMCTALFFAYGRYLYPTRAIRWCVRVAAMGYALPGTIIAIGILVVLSWFAKIPLLFNVSQWLLGGSLVTLVFAYLVRYLFVGLNSAESGLSKIKPSMDEASRLMGKSDWERLTSIHFPLIRSSLLAGFLLTFVDILKELPATLLLRPFNFSTLAIRSYELANSERIYDMACPALVIVLIGVVFVVLLNPVLSLSRYRNASSA